MICPAKGENMKYYEKRKHLITKTALLLVVLGALFFALFDCTPKTQQQEIAIVFERM